MALLRNTTFMGVGNSRGKVLGPVRAEDLREVARDQALVFELLTNSDAVGDGTAPPTTVGHDHTEEGNLLFWPIMSQSFGDSSRSLTSGDPQSINATVSVSTASNQEDLWHFPVYVPVGWGGRDFYVIVDSMDGRDVQLRLFLHDATLTPIVGQQDKQFFRSNGPDEDGQPMDFRADEPQNLWVAKFTPTIAGLHTVLIKANIDTDAAYNVKRFSSICIIPRIPPGDMDRMNGPAKRPMFTDWTGSDYQVGDPDSSPANDWHEIDDNFAVNDGAMGAVIALLANNDALLQELSRGLPTAGNATLSLPNFTAGAKRGHDHSNDTPTGLAFSTGKSLSYSIGSWAFGRVEQIADIFGGGTLGPVPIEQTGADPAVYVDWTQIRLRLHQHQDVTGGTSTLRAAVVTEVPQSPGPTMEMKVQLTVGSSVLATGTIPSTNGYHITTLSAFGYTAAADNELLISLNRDGKNGNTMGHALVGLCLYFDPP